MEYLKHGFLFKNWWDTQFTLFLTLSCRNQTTSLLSNDPQIHYLSLLSFSSVYVYKPCFLYGYMIVCSNLAKHQLQLQWRAFGCWGLWGERREAWGKETLNLSFYFLFPFLFFSFYSPFPPFPYFIFSLHPIALFSVSSMTTYNAQTRIYEFPQRPFSQIPLQSIFKYVKKNRIPRVRKFILASRALSVCVFFVKSQGGTTPKKRSFKRRWKHIKSE